MSTAIFEASGRGMRRAGYGALLAVVTLVLSTIALLLFFGGVAYVFGPINDVLIALTLLLLVPAIWVVRDLARGRGVGAWFTVLSAIAALGMIEAAAGQLLLVARVISLQASFVTGGVGILPFLVWMGVVAILALRRGVVSRSVGWWSLAFLAVSVLAGAASPFLPMATLVFTFGVGWLVAFGGWILALGRDLLQRAEPG